MANTSPDYWFLEPAVISEFRTPAFTSHNDVTALVDGKEYYDHLTARLSAAVSGDFYYFTAWRATRGMRLQPDVSSTLTYESLLRSALQAGVDVRGMMWYVFSSVRYRASGGSGHVSENIEMVNLLNTAPSPTPMQRGVLDRRLVSNVASHHQKTSILTVGGEFWAYCGGLDIAPDRWDTPAHNNPSHRPKENFEGWHDVQVAVQGPAVAQIHQNFLARWNDPTPPHTVSGVPGGSVPPTITPITPPPAAGNHHVQLTRTLACKSTYAWRPAGEQSARMAYERAIDRAQHYIYIEDQYAWPSSLTTKLRDAANRGVKIIFVLAHQYDMAALRLHHNRMRHSLFLDVIRSGTGAANVFAYHLQRPGGGADIYVHSKVMIVDDCLAMIGSTNVGYRSHTTDSELHVSVVDGDTVSNPMNGASTTVCRFARDLRVKLWREHLGKSTGLDDPIASLSAWPTGTAQVHHALVHPSPPWFKRKPGLISLVMNKRTRCP